METIGKGQYVIYKDKVLGKGSYSVVYLGKCLIDSEYVKTGSDVAIKVIKTKGMTDKYRSILNGELDIMKMIKYDPHPNIVACYDIFESAEETHIIMENCDSGDLRSIIKKPIKEKYAQFYFWIRER